MYEEVQGSYPDYWYTTTDSSSYNPYSYEYQSNDDRNFFFPFVLGGITGGLLAPAFYRPYPYYRPYFPYQPYPYYRRWY